MYYCFFKRKTSSAFCFKVVFAVLVWILTLMFEPADGSKWPSMTLFTLWVAPLKWLHKKDIWRTVSGQFLESLPPRSQCLVIATHACNSGPFIWVNISHITAHLSELIFYEASLPVCRSSLHVMTGCRNSDYSVPLFLLCMNKNDHWEKKWRLLIYANMPLSWTLIFLYDFH